MFILITIVKMESATAKKAFHWYEIEIFTSQKLWIYSLVDSKLAELFKLYGKFVNP